VVVNVGAGTGSYEPRDREVLAVEPSAEMRGQRPEGSARCVAGSAERLPLPDASVDAAMALYTDFHWQDRAAGIGELRRVSRDRIVLLTVDRNAAERFWLTRDYLPEANEMFSPLAAVTELFPTPPQVIPLPIPDDCEDGFVHAFWRRPVALLDRDRRRTMAMLARLPSAVVEPALRRLRADLETGAWAERNPELSGLKALDLGHRLIVWRGRAFA
jgi:hypothetical protein